MTNCQIVSESLEGEGESQIGKVTFIASMIQVDSRENTAFMETSTFERAGKHIRGGAWLYKDGIAEPVKVVNDDDNDDGGNNDIDIDIDDTNNTNEVATIERE